MRGIASIVGNFLSPRGVQQGFVAVPIDVKAIGLGTPNEDLRRKRNNNLIFFEDRALREPGIIAWLFFLNKKSKVGYRYEFKI